jgi:hypothetical protein
LAGRGVGGGGGGGAVVSGAPSVPAELSIAAIESLAGVVVISRPKSSSTENNSKIITEKH